jgi:hypothetical protein
MPLNFPELSVDDIIAHCQPICQVKQIIRQRMQLTSIDQQSAAIPVWRVAARCATIRAGRGRSNAARSPSLIRHIMAGDQAPG